MSFLPDPFGCSVSRQACLCAGFCLPPRDLQSQYKHRLPLHSTNRHTTLAVPLKRLVLPDGRSTCRHL